ncbi:MAG: DUF502 domain-containing protein [Alphaproteobacteria bacterium]|nr:DUF502 domain-containing protein [Alphaproteobacteria bacterium]
MSDDTLPPEPPSHGTHRARVMQRMRAAFVAGLLVVVPIAVSLGVILTVAGWVDDLQPDLLWGRKIPGAGILLTATSILLVGLLTQNWVGNRIVAWYEGWLHQVPIFNSLYRGSKQVVQTVLSEGSSSVKGVVLVEWPRAGTWCLAFHTGEGFLRRDDGVRMLNVFLPSTPNPTTGFYFMVAENDVMRTDLTVEDAAKLLMSAGLVGAPAPIRVQTPQGAVPIRLPVSGGS